MKLQSVRLVDSSSGFSSFVRAYKVGIQVRNQQEIKWDDDQQRRHVLEEVVPS